MEDLLCKCHWDLANASIKGNAIATKVVVCASVLIVRTNEVVHQVS